MLVFMTAGIVLGLSAGFSPGPLMALVIAQSLRYGSREGVKVAVAPVLTDLPVIVVCLFVLSSLPESGAVLGVISTAGGIFVAYLAISSMRVTGLNTEGIQPSPRSLGRGMLVNVLSPHPYIFWLTVGAPVMMKAWKENSMAAVLFVAGFYCCLVGAKIFLAIAAGRSRKLLSRKAYTVLMRALGLMLLAFAVLLVMEGLRYFGAVVR